jgi:hypothetical protein
MLKRQIKSLMPLAVMNYLYGRKARAFALGVPKSGTTSIAGLFSRQARSGHEPHRPETVHDMYGHFRGEISDEQLIKSYRVRDKQLMLTLESNCFLAYRPDLLYATFPHSKFIVTIRNPLTWLDSIFDNNLNFPRGKTPTMTRWHQVFFQDTDTSNRNGDNPLVERGLYPLDTYLAYWARTYRSILHALPSEERLIVGTNQISRRADEIGKFVGIDLSSNRSHVIHRNKTSIKHRVLEELDERYVADRINHQCHRLIAEFDLGELW